MLGGKRLRVRRSKTFLLYLVLPEDINLRQHRCDNFAPLLRSRSFKDNPESERTKRTVLVKRRNSDSKSDSTYTTSNGRVTVTINCD